MILPSKASYRSMQLADVPGILALGKDCFPSIPEERHWKPDMLKAHVETFPEGQMVAELGGRLVGSATALRVRLVDALSPHTWRSISGGGYLTTHVPDGEVLYGTEIMVHPDARRRGIARGLYKLRMDLIRRHNMRAFVSGGRIPGYEKHAARMSAAEYVNAILEGKLTDRTLSPQLKSAITVAGVLPDYMTDPRSHNYATLLVWWNLDWIPGK